MMTHAVSDTDLQAYLDDELDPLHSLAVEAYLARHPAAAAQLMADRRLRTELRLALAPEPVIQPNEQAAEPSRDLLVVRSVHWWILPGRRRTG